MLPGFDLENCTRCCADKDDKGQVVFRPADDRLSQVTHYTHHDLPTDAVMDPASNSALPNTGTRGEASLNGENAATLSLSENTSDDPPSNVWSSSSIGPHEKSRIIGVMKNFAEKAYHGVEAWTVGAALGEVLPIRYVLTQDLAQLVLQASGKPDISCAIASVTQCLLGAQCSLSPHSQLAQTLDEQLLKRLVVLQCGNRALYIIEHTEQDAEQLLTAIWVLRSYNRHKSGAFKEPEPEPVRSTI